MEPKKIVVVVLMLIFIAGLGFFGYSKIVNHNGSTGEKTTETTLPNPMVERASTDEIQTALGFSFTALPTNMTDTKYFTIDNTIAEADFTSGGVAYTVRKAKAITDNIAGVYTQFGSSQTLVNSTGNDVLYQYNDGSEGLATWTAGDYCYSVFCTSGAQLDAVQSIVNAVS